MEEPRQSSKKTFKAAQPVLFSVCVAKNTDETQTPKFKPFSCAQTSFWVFPKLAEGSRGWQLVERWPVRKCRADQTAEPRSARFGDIQNKSQAEFVVGFLPPLCSWSLQNSVVKFFSFLFPQFLEINVNRFQIPRR